MIANYWQRYCVKNDTIGFFGPLSWGLIDEGSPGVAAEPGQGLLAQREVRFESWCIEALADELARDERIRPWIAPRRRPERAGPETLTPDAEAALAVCDGRRLARDMAPAEVLAELEAAELITWRFAVPLESYPEDSTRPSPVSPAGSRPGRRERCTAPGSWATRTAGASSLMC